jgi:hypothetical protein
MATSKRAVAFILGAVALAGCAVTASPGAQVRVRVATAAFEQHSPAQLSERIGQRSRKDSPGTSACKGGNTKACIEVGDRLVVKHAPVEALRWYTIACDRVINSMLPGATRMMQLSQSLKEHSATRGDQEPNPASQKRVAELKDEASEMKARIQGCFDAGDTLKSDAELRQSLKYFDAACEFTTLLGVVGEAMPGLEYVANNGCSAGEAVRAQLSGQPAFSPRLFVELVEPKAKAKPEKKQSVQQSDDGMVFSESDL